MAEATQGKVKFIRVRGRVVPMRDKSGGGTSKAIAAPRTGPASRPGSSPGQSANRAKRNAGYKWAGLLGGIEGLIRGGIEGGVKGGLEKGMRGAALGAGAGVVAGLASWGLVDGAITLAYGSRKNYEMKVYGSKVKVRTKKKKRDKK